VKADNFFADNGTLYLHTVNGMYQHKPNSTGPFWKKRVAANDLGIIVQGRDGLLAFNEHSQLFKKPNGTSDWQPVYKNIPEKPVLNIFESASGSVFLGGRSGLFKSTNSGKTWKQVRKGGWVMKMAEADGVLLAASVHGILRSTDDGENWDLVISEGGVGIAVENINGGFAVITFNTESNTRRIRSSYDGGKTWQPIDAGLPPQASISSIVSGDNSWQTGDNSRAAQASISSVTQMGDYLFCGHPAGVFRSVNKGKTWDLVLPAVSDKVFNVYISGNVIYAIPRSGGC
jgi:photosystem II stability/assembly factor-like uncharacterized protein